MYIKTGKALKNLKVSRTRFCKYKQSSELFRPVRYGVYRQDQIDIIALVLDGQIDMQTAEELWTKAKQDSIRKVYQASGLSSR